jgi:hypothetical protein
MPGFRNRPSDQRFILDDQHAQAIEGIFALAGQFAQPRRRADAPRSRFSD